MAYTIACSNIKGGTGKTSTVGSLSGIWAAQGYRVLAIDADPQSNLSIGLGVNPDNQEQTLVEALVDDKITLNDVMVKLPEGFSLVPAHISLHALELRMVSMFSREKILKRKLEEVQNDFDIIITDCSPSINMLTINCLSAADGVLIPVQANSFYALYGMSQLMNTIQYVQSDPNPSLRVLGVVLTMTTNTKIAKEVTTQIKENFGDKLLKATIRLNTKMAEAPAMGQTIAMYAGDSSVAEDYRQLAQEVVKRAKIK